MTDLGFRKNALILNSYFTYLKKVYNEGIIEELYNDRKNIANNTFNYRLNAGVNAGASAGTGNSMEEYAS